MRSRLRKSLYRSCLSWWRRLALVPGGVLDFLESIFEEIGHNSAVDWLMKVGPMLICLEAMLICLVAAESVGEYGI